MLRRVKAVFVPPVIKVLSPNVPPPNITLPGATSKLSGVVVPIPTFPDAATAIERVERPKPVVVATWKISDDPDTSPRTGATEKRACGVVVPIPTKPVKPTPAACVTIMVGRFELNPTAREFAVELESR